MRSLNSYGRGIGRHGDSPSNSSHILNTVARAPKGSAETSQLPEMIAAAELAGVDVRAARLMLDKGCDVIEQGKLDRWV